MSATVSTVLPDDYYLRNFHELIRFVYQTYRSVLTDTEQTFFHDFESLPENARRLYIRLVCRSRTDFRLSKLSYAEIPDIVDAAESLSERGFLALDAVTDFDALMQLFTRDELIRELNLNTQRQLRRPELVEWIKENLTLDKVREALGQGERIVSVKHEAVFAVYRLCFFGNLYQDMTEFVLRDLGLTQFEPYIIDTETRAFQSREQLDAHIQYYLCQDAFASVEDASVDNLLEIHRSLPEIVPGDLNLRRRVERFSNQIARQLERVGEYETALTLYQAVQRPPSRERQARLLAANVSGEAALVLCRQILEAPIDEEEREFALQFGGRTAKKIKQDWSGLPAYQPEKLTLELDRTDQVEIAVAEALCENGQCYYTENTLFNAVFGLTFWDIVFAPVPGVFFNPFQSHPTDLFESGFHAQRSDAIARRFAETDSIEALTHRVKSTIELKDGIQNPFVYWRYLQPELIELALDRIPLDHWHAVFYRVLQDLRNHRSGFPDLIHFPESGGYQLVEVKGPGDKLQKNQIRWMRFFAERGIPHQVAYVSWSVDATA